MPSAPTLPLRFEMAHGGICKDVFREIKEPLDSLGCKLRVLCLISLIFYDSQHFNNKKKKLQINFIKKSYIF